MASFGRKKVFKRKVKELSLKLQKLKGKIKVQCIKYKGGSTNSLHTFTGQN